MLVGGELTLWPFIGPGSDPQENVAGIGLGDGDGAVTVDSQLNYSGYGPLPRHYLAEKHAHSVARSGYFIWQVECRSTEVSEEVRRRLSGLTKSGQMNVSDREDPTRTAEQLLDE